MNTHKLSYPKDMLTRLGFGDNESIMDQLADAIAKQPHDCVLDTEAQFSEGSILSSTLFFHSFHRVEKYFLSRYIARLQYSNTALKGRCQTFFVSRGARITQKEAYNLLQGRAVYKDHLIDADGETYSAWLQLIFDQTLPSGNYPTRQFRTNYGYDLEKVLQQYPIRECQQADTLTALIRLLQSGNLVPVDFLKPRKTQQLYIAANPLYKTINISSVGSEPPRNDPQ